MATRARPDRLGVVYTPREVCEPMVRRALAPLLGRDLRSLRICDPAIGEGAFLIEVLRVLAEAGAPPREVAARCLYGADIDARAVATARAAIEAFVGGPVPALRDHLRAGDALALDWPNRFDLLVGNPPYIRQERLGDAKRALRSYEAYDGVADLYVYFVELAQRIAKRWCLIVPNKWLTAAYGRPLRELLSRAGSIEQIVDFGGGLFDVDAFPCIVVGDEQPRALHASRAATTVAAALAEPGIPHDRARWRGEPWHIDTAADRALIDRLERTWPALGASFRPSRGVVTGCNRAFVIDAATRAQLLAAEPAAAALIRPFIKGRDVRRWEPAPIERYILLVDRGTSLAKLPRVRAHLAQFRDALEPGSGRKPGSYRWYELQDPVVPLARARGPRLFYQDIQTQPACSFDPTGELVPDTTVWILPSADPFLLALLNSQLYAWYARRRFPPALNGAIRPKLEYMRALPLATPSPSLHRRIANIVQARDDARLDAAICDAYELTPAERALVAR